MMQQFKMVIATAAFAACLTLALGADAKPPPGTDLNSAMHRWFECQKQPTSGASCCSIADGHVLSEDQWSIRGNGYRVKIGAVWYEVPANRVIASRCGPNPTASPVVWWGYVAGEPMIFCFLPGTEV